MYDYWPPYVSVAERKKKAEETIAKKLKKGEKINPVVIEGRTIVRSFWGKAWCKHLESFSDYANRLPRGRSYVRHGAVIHLEVSKSRVEAKVQGSSMYSVTINISPANDDAWQAIVKICSGEIGSVIELLKGKISDNVMATMTDKHHGLFPKPKEISLKCSCPDGAMMCKHVAAVLYGIGTRLDQEPELLFILRNVDHMQLLETTSMVSTASAETSSIAADEDLSALFGIDIETSEMNSETGKKTSKTRENTSSTSKKSYKKNTLTKKESSTKNKRNNI